MIVVEVLVRRVAGYVQMYVCAACLCCMFVSTGLHVCTCRSQLAGSMFGRSCESAVQVWVSPLLGCHCHPVSRRGNLALVSVT